MKNPNGKLMYQWASELFPQCRSITGKGQRDTLKYFEKINPDLNRIKFNTGDRVFDWVIPKEWIINDSYIEHESGIKFAEFSKSNLHVLNYSSPINQSMPKKELLKNIYTQEGFPSAIPYVTSYYKDNWGFCMSQDDLESLPDGKYRAYIDSNFIDGTLEMSEACLSGKDNQEIFFSTYVCHPSMANNELSGPVLASALMSYIKNNYPDNRMSYRFVFLPETIGSIAYLSKRHKLLKSNVLAGYVLSCVGDNLEYSLIHGPEKFCLADISVEAALIGKKNYKEYSFLDRGSDERQYCSPGIDLPVCGFSRTKYGEFNEYHTDKDDMDFISIEGLQGSFDVFKNIIDAYELGLKPKSTVFCEPFLSRHNLIDQISKKGNHSDDVILRKNLIAFSNGKRSIFDIAKILDTPLEVIINELDLLIKNKIIKTEY
jgi:aminopeptidase-like protein